MRRNAYRFLIVILLLDIGFISAQETSEEARWSPRVTTMIGLRPIDQWGKYSPVNATPGNETGIFPSYATTFQVGGGVTFRYDEKISLLCDVSFQNTLAKGHSAAQRYLTCGLSGEYRIKRVYVDLGAFLALDPEINAFVCYPAGVVRSSRFHYGPSLGGGYLLPVSECVTLRLGMHCSLGFYRFCDYNNQSNVPPEYREHKVFYIVPTSLFSLQIEWTKVRKQHQ